MEESINVEEKFSGNWSLAALAGFIFSLLFFWGYLIIDDTVIRSVVRLVAFVLFASAVFSGLKLLDGKHTISLSIQDNFLEITFFRKEKQVDKAVFTLSDITGIRVGPLSPHVFTNRFLIEDYNLSLIMEDYDRPLPLLQVKGRSLSVNKDTAERISNFIETHAHNIERSVVGQYDRPD